MGAKRKSLTRLDRVKASTVAEAFADDWAAAPGSLYADSPFLPLWQMSSRRKGAHMERVLHRLLDDAGYPVSKASTSEHDRTVNGLKVEVKGSFLWEGPTPRFTWQQIRLEQDYDVLILMAFYPDVLRMAAATRAEVRRHLHVQDAQGRWTHNQHGGISVNSGTFMLHGHLEDYSWLRPLPELLGPPQS